MRGMTGHLSLGERIAWYRRRRGLSQEVVAGLVGRTVDWLSKVENGRIEIDRLSVIRGLAEVLDIAVGDLLNEPSLLEWTADSGSRTVPGLRSALMDYQRITQMPTHHADGPPLPLARLGANLDSIWQAYQESRFGYVTGHIAELVQDSQLAAKSYEGDESVRAHGILALTYQAAATTLIKVGEHDLAWIASDRGLAAAQQTDNAAVRGSLFRSVVHTLLSTGRYSEAVHLTEHAADVLSPELDDADDTMLSVYGTLLLAGSMAAARAENRDATQTFLDTAADLARRLGRDDNRLWTAFGPTNVAIHRVSTAMELGDVQVAADLGPQINTASMPIERRVRHELEIARALNMRNRTGDALSKLLEAEQLAPEQVRYHYISRHLVQSWIRNQRGKPSVGLAGLAQRINVV
ncbi:helix-turn-helix domain-containing protein [Kribbella sp. NPDC051620]|uniref:helix-turn-helix domain-containing protein n=1 Tax=Kribbella sp. NPDC051620 TaxID=3364120 RepID=UPI0037A76E0C